MWSMFVGLYVGAVLVVRYVGLGLWVDIGVVVLVVLWVGLVVVVVYGPVVLLTRYLDCFDFIFRSAFNLPSILLFLLVANSI